jgi:precorrin-3B methylase
MTEAFAENLKAKLDVADTAAGSALVQAAAPAVVQEAEAPAPKTRVEPRPGVRAASAKAANAPLDVGNLFWKMLWSRLRGLFSFAAR